MLCMACGSDGVKQIYRGVKDSLFGADGTFDYYECCSCGTFKMVANIEPGSQYTPSYSGRKKRSENIIKNYFRKILVFMGRGRCATDEAGRITCALVKILKYVKLLDKRVLSEKLWVPNPKGDEDNRILDVGCGNGYYIEYMQNMGWSADGVEIDVESYNNSRKRGLSVYLGDLSCLELEKDSYDIITVRHVIEHIKDPKLFLNECYSLLKSGGRVYITTPNSQSYCSSKYHDDWLGLDVSRHENIFSVDGLLRLVDNSNFRVIKINTNLRITKFVSRASYLRRVRKNVYYGMNLNAFFVSLFDYYKAGVSQESGDEIFCVLEK